MTIADFERKLTDITRAAIVNLRRRIGTERLYAVALYTSDVDAYEYVCASANTEEALDRSIAKALARKPGKSRIEVERSLRWNAGDWGYHDFASEVSVLAVPPNETSRSAKRVYEAFCSALVTLDKEGRFGTGDERAGIVLNVLCGDMGDEFFERGLRKLNAASVVEGYLAKWTAEPFVRRVGAMPVAEQVSTWVLLYEALYLGRGDVPSEALAVGLTWMDVEKQLEKLGAAALPELLRLLQRHALARTFSEKGSDEFKRDGACTRESSLASSTTFLIGRIGGLSTMMIGQVQMLIAQAVERDRDLPLASPIAENMARMLHGVTPRRFPKTVVSSGTNHLVNADAYVAKA